jgi:hypothetical protein
VNLYCEVVPRTFIWTWITEVECQTNFLILIAECRCRSLCGTVPQIKGELSRLTSRGSKRDLSEKALKTSNDLLRIFKLRKRKSVLTI